MSQHATDLQQRIAGGETILLAEISPPRGADGAPIREAARRLAGKVHALALSDNREGVTMAALAAAWLVAAEGVEPILHVTTRDRNRIALVSEALGAQALGIRNLLCTSGTHQTLGRSRAAKNVYDVDSIQLLMTYAGLACDGGLVGEPGGMEGAGGLCLGAVASPDADPLELQVARLVKKVRAGAQFLITQPVYDLERFGAWWKEVTRRGIHQQAAILAGVRPLCGGALAEAQAAKRPLARIPEPVLQRIQSAGDAAAGRAAAIEIALETMGRLSGFGGLRGFSVCADGDLDAALAVIEKSGRGRD
jgi:methylenetetrahydrofolate reductase (NADPH)